MATELHDNLLILDDYRAREAAKRLGLKITGTLGILIRAKQARVVDEVKPILDALMDIGFRLNEVIYLEVLRIVGETE